jgi:hypothetical protein
VKYAGKRISSVTDTEYVVMNNSMNVFVINNIEIIMLWLVINCCACVFLFPNGLVIYDTMQLSLYTILRITCYYI